MWLLVNHTKPTNTFETNWLLAKELCSYSFVRSFTLFPIFALTQWTVFRYHRIKLVQTVDQSVNTTSVYFCACNAYWHNGIKQARKVIVNHWSAIICSIYTSTLSVVTIKKAHDNGKAKNKLSI